MLKAAVWTQACVSPCVSPALPSNMECAPAMPAPIGTADRPGSAAAAPSISFADLIGSSGSVLNREDDIAAGELLDSPKHDSGAPPDAVLQSLAALFGMAFATCPKQLTMDALGPGSGRSDIGFAAADTFTGGAGLNDMLRLATSVPALPDSDQALAGEAEAGAAAGGATARLSEEVQSAPDPAPSGTPGRPGTPANRAEERYDNDEMWPSAERMHAVAVTLTPSTPVLTGDGIAPQTEPAAGVKSGGPNPSFAEGVVSTARTNMANAPLPNGHSVLAFAAKLTAIDQKVAGRAVARDIGMRTPQLAGGSTPPTAATAAIGAEGPTVIEPNATAAQETSTVTSPPAELGADSRRNMTPDYANRASQGDLAPSDSLPKSSGDGAKPSSSVSQQPHWRAAERGPDTDRMPVRQPASISVTYNAAPTAPETTAGKTASQGAVQTAPAGRSAPLEIPLPDSEPKTASVQNLRIRVAADSASPVDVLLRQRGGAVHVAVYSPDPATAAPLREELPGLVSRLERTGYHTEILITKEQATSQVREAQAASQHDADAQDRERDRRHQPQPWDEEKLRPRARGQHDPSFDFERIREAIL